MMDLTPLKNVDIYLLDQLLKERIHPEQRVLDAGCGKGRNFRFLANQSFDVIGIDPNETYINELIAEIPDKQEKLIVSSIEEYGDSNGFDAVICNAVLHFAKDHTHFQVLFQKLVSLLRPDGLLFIRMTSNIGIEERLKEETSGFYTIPDGSSRYLITREVIAELIKTYQLTLLEPVKTVNVEDKRCMTTLVFEK